MKRIGAALIGYGVAGKCFHAPFLTGLPSFELRGILVRTSKGLLPNVRYYTDLEELIKDSVDVVVIATPPESHYSLGIKLINAGKNIVIDKPFTCTASEGEELILAAKAKGVLLSVYQNRRWDSGFKTVKKLIKSKALGKIVEYSSRFDRWRPERNVGKWREQGGPGTGVIFDIGSHLIDQALHLFGSPQSVRANVFTLNPERPTDDFFEITFRYSDFIAKLRASSFVSSPFPHFEIHGTEASFLKFDLDPQEEKLKRDGVFTESSEWGKESSDRNGKLYRMNNGKREEVIIQTENGSYQSFYEGVAAAIHGGGKTPVPGEEALKVIEMIEHCKKSANSGTEIFCK